MSAAFLCSHAGIQPRVIENQAAYLGGWLKQIKADKKLVISAAGKGPGGGVDSDPRIRNERNVPE